MAQQGSSIRAALDCLYVPVVVFWIILSTTMYSILCVIGGLFSEKAAWFFARFWWNQLLFVCRINIVIKGLEKLKPDGQYVFVSNHQSLLDILVLFRILPQKVRFIAKKELFKIPFFGWAMRSMGHISIDRSNARNARKSIDSAVVRIHSEHISTVVFPEGTRSITGEVGEFKQGAFTMALEAGLPLVPVSFSGRAMIVGKKIFYRSGTIFMVIGDAVDVSGIDKSERKDLMHQMRDIIVHNIHTS